MYARSTFRARARAVLGTGVCVQPVEPLAGGVGRRRLDFAGRWHCPVGPWDCRGHIARLEGGRLFLWGWEGMRCLCAWAGVVLACWRVCVCAYGFRACLACVICCHLGKFPAFSGPDRRHCFGSLVELVPGGSLAGPAAGAGCLVPPLMWAGVCV